MKPDEKPQPTSMAGSDWQRQALSAARTAAAAAKHSDAASPAMEIARQRAEAQQVPDMLAAAEPASAAQSVQSQQSQPQPVDQGAATGEATGKPVVSGAFVEDTPMAAPVVGTGGTSTAKKVVVALLMLIVLLGAGAAGYLFLGKDNNAGNNQQNSPGASTSEDEDAAEVDLTVNTRNTQRATDAGVALIAVSVYVSNNVGRLPTLYADDKLLAVTDGVEDVPSELKLDYYEFIQVKAGAQQPPDKDELWLVVGAVCDPETGGAVAGVSRAVAALYGEETSTGEFKGTCKDS